MALASAGAADRGRAASSPSLALAELRRSFTLGGKPVPPEIFRDFGDGDLADSGSIWVTVDLRAAIGSNLYTDDVTTDGAWRRQTKAAGRGTGLVEETAYRFVGATRSGLPIVIARYSGGGSGLFTTLHILDAAAALAFDLDGKRYDRLDLTQVRSVALGDRWDGEVKITGDTVAITTTGGVPASADRRPSMMTIEARRP